MKQAAEVQVTLRLPREEYERASRSAMEEQRSLEEYLQSLLTDRLHAEASVREALERLSDDYRARLQSEGKLQASTEEITRELAGARQRIADELYPG